MKRTNTVDTDILKLPVLKLKSKAQHVKFNEIVEEEENHETEKNNWSNIANSILTPFMTSNRYLLKHIMKIEAGSPKNKNSSNDLLNQASTFSQTILGSKLNRTKTKFGFAEKKFDSRRASPRRRVSSPSKGEIMGYHFPKAECTTKSENLCVKT